MCKIMSSRRGTLSKLNKISSAINKQKVYINAEWNSIKDTSLFRVF